MPSTTTVSNCISSSYKGLQRILSKKLSNFPHLLNKLVFNSLKCRNDLSLIAENW